MIIKKWDWLLKKKRNTNIDNLDSGQEGHESTIFQGIILEHAMRECKHWNNENSFALAIPW